LIQVIGKIHVDYKEDSSSHTRDYMFCVRISASLVRNVASFSSAKVLPGVVAVFANGLGSDKILIFGVNTEGLLPRFSSVGTNAMGLFGVRFGVKAVRPPGRCFTGLRGVRSNGEGAKTAASAGAVVEVCCSGSLALLRPLDGAATWNPASYVACRGSGARGIGVSATPDIVFDLSAIATDVSPIAFSFLSSFSSLRCADVLAF
jgi:hypothetical protein